MVTKRRVTFNKLYISTKPFLTLAESEVDISHLLAQVVTLLTLPNVTNDR